MSHLIDFDALSWDEPVKGVRSKTIVKGNQQLRLVEFSFGFVESDWCIMGHAGNVLEGEFTIDYSGTLERYQAGDIFFIPKGENDKHKAILGEGEKVLLLLFEMLDA